MARLPATNGDEGNWGAILNEYLLVSHNLDGTSKNVFDTVVEPGLRAVSGSIDGETAIVRGYHESGDGGGGIFYWDSAASISDDNGGTIIATTSAATGVWRRVFAGQIDIRWFGARPDDTTVIAVSNQVGNSLPSPVDKQTACGDAIQRAIDYVHSVGGGRVFIPPGLWWISSYIVVKPHVEVAGSGPGSVLKSLDSAPNAHGYGILQCGPYKEGLLPEGSRLSMTVRDLVLDGNTLNRQPLGQFQAYNLVVYDHLSYNDPLRLYATDVRIKNVTSLNSPIDCFAVVLYNTTERDRVSVTDCFFSDAFRNVVSIVSATNVQFSNCDFKNAGVPHGGISPKACVDLEPDASRPINKNITFTGCRFTNGVHYALASSNSQAMFSDCTFATGQNTERQLAFNIRTSDIQISASRLVGIEGAHGRDYYFRQESAPAAGKEPFDNTAKNRLEIVDSVFEGIGLELQGHQSFVTDCSFVNSRRAVLFFPAFGRMQGCILQNMGWEASNGGAFASLTTHNDQTNKHITFADILVRVNNLIRPTDFATPARQYGVSFHLTNPFTVHLINVRSEGFYTLGSNAGDYRDWGVPNLPPADSTNNDGAIIRGCTFGGQSFTAEVSRDG